MLGSFFCLFETLIDLFLNLVLLTYLLTYKNTVSRPMWKDFCWSSWNIRYTIGRKHSVNVRLKHGWSTVLNNGEKATEKKLKENRWLREKGEAEIKVQPSAVTRTDWGFAVDVAWLWRRRVEVTGRWSVRRVDLAGNEPNCWWRHSAWSMCRHRMTQKISFIVCAVTSRDVA